MKKGKTRSIYFSLGGQYERIEAEAAERGLSFNAYVAQSADPLGPFHRGGGSQLDRIESKLDELLGVSVRHRLPEIPKKGHDDFESELVAESGAKILAEAQARLDAEKKSRNIKEDKIKRVREGIKSLTGHAGGYSKDFQIGKR